MHLAITFVRRCVWSAWRPWTRVGQPWLRASAPLAMWRAQLQTARQERRKGQAGVLPAPSNHTGSPKALAAWWLSAQLCLQPRDCQALLRRLSPLSLPTASEVPPAPFQSGPQLLRPAPPPRLCRPVQTDSEAIPLAFREASCLGPPPRKIFPGTFTRISVVFSPVCSPECTPFPFQFSPRMRNKSFLRNITGHVNCLRLSFFNHEPKSLSPPSETKRKRHFKALQSARPLNPVASPLHPAFRGSLEPRGCIYHKSVQSPFKSIQAVASRGGVQATPGWGGG